MSYEKLYQIYFAIATLFAFTMFSSNLETNQRVYGAKNETKTSTGVLETKKDGKEDLPKTIQTIGNKIAGTQSFVSIAGNNIQKKTIEKSENTVKSAKKIEGVKSYEKSKIYRNGWNDPRVQYAYDISGGDMDFIKTIEAESKWDVNALGDKGKSFGLCQIHKGYNPAMQKAYRELKTDNDKVKMCYDQYKDWVSRGVIKTRLYGYNVRNKQQNKKPFTIK